ncbi:MAG: peroxiredoxin [Acidobacteria bacterium]|jgi:peroxiredoxin Q/BCP|nr:peroxiredoxin [Acidobacteriota bacterium]MBA3785349.1 peroxiredoxin [Acidobacteriota bacterium]MBA4121675.1 peroxiredoxin [Acidobacteriota bacterium]
MRIGENAPDFTLKDGDGNDWKLSERRGKTVVLLFYPGDNTPVCTKQMCSVRDNWEDYAKTGAEVVGISTDSAASHKDFSQKYDLPLTLLSDEKGEVVEKFNVKSWLPGRSARAVVVVDKNGVVRHHQVQSLSVFRPKDDEVLKAIGQANAA